MTHQTENSWVHRQWHKIRILKSLLEPHQLLDKLKVRICTGSSVFDTLVALVVCDALGEDHIGNTNSGWARDTLHAVHVDFSTLTSTIRHELDSVIEATCYILTRMVFQVVALVDHTLIFMIVFAVISGTVNHVGDANIFKDFPVFGHEIAT